MHDTWGWWAADVAVKGLAVLAANSPTSHVTNCTPGAAGDGIEQTVTSRVGCGLSYDAATDTYTYVWKTDKAWAGGCRQLVVTLADGTM